MTTTTDPVIVAPMNRTGVALWTPNGPRIVHTEGDTSPVGSHTEGDLFAQWSHTEGDASHTTSHTETDTPTVGSHTEGDTSHTGSHTEGDTPTVGTHTSHVGTHDDSHTEEDTSHMHTPNDQDVSTVGTDVGTHVGTHDDESRGTDHMHITDARRTEVAALSSKAEQIRHICELLGNPDTAEVHTWLEACEVDADRKYVSRIVNTWRRERGLTDTGAFAVLTDADLAELAEQDNADTDPTDAPPADPETETADTELAARVRRAQARIPLQSDEALYSALSDEEMDKERDLAEKERETAREIRRRRMAADLAKAKRDQATAEAVAKSEASDARWLQRARSKKRRLTSDDAKLAQTVRNSEWSSRGLIAAVAVGMLWSAVNAQKNLVPSGNMADPLFWLSYGVEAMISLPLIIIMVASASATRMGRVMPTEQKRKVYAVEGALLLTTLALNVGPHLNPPNNADVDPVNLFKFGIAPVMVGVLLQVHAWASDHYADLIMHSGTTTSAVQEDQPGNADATTILPEVVHPSTSREVAYALDRSLAEVQAARRRK
ncbi:hypothetical protein [Nocardia flavorosea]|uniref:DUF2637 domain-containing protein n=1 Tax=Nocardia flavorosea TaxID=53429 RepID=A0A846YTW6_9NOCA|nr:hypothetical protein [Nocardia flavorosea]NKY60990.1 hypothetical protein [Nocardia flavorosea]